MKKFLFGCLMGSFLVLTVNFTANLMFHVGLDNDNEKMTDYSMYIGNLLDGSATVNVLTKRCTLDEGRHGTRREYFNCNKVQIFFSDLINGEKDGSI